METATLPKMEFRRFGKTDEMISVITLGGMRYKQGWNPPRNLLLKESLDQCMDITYRALELGINHIETAYGYMKSEHLYGATFRELRVPRDRFKMMTKGAPMTGEETRELVEKQLQALQLDYIDFYGWHGINNRERLDAAVKKGGPVETLHRLKEEGLIRNIGFSTHGPVEIIMEAIQTDLFSFINLHFYYFFQRNLSAIQLAGEKDLGIFIISPNDKGGNLWNPSEKLAMLCSPLTALQFNGRFCLSYPQITTLSMGINKAEQFGTNFALLNDHQYLTEDDLVVKDRLDAQWNTVTDFCTVCHECLPCPEDINIPEVLRFRNMVKGFDMKDFGKYRYNMFEEKGHWFPGAFAFKCTECGDCLPRCPEKLPIPNLLKETHKELFDLKAYIKQKTLQILRKIYLIFFNGA